jgi:error-prone DNA polymerase
MFLTIEDSELSVNIIVWPHIAERDRAALLGAHVLGIYGRVQKQGIVTHFIADALHACDHYLGLLQAEPDKLAANSSDILSAKKKAEMQLKSRDFR